MFETEVLWVTALPPLPPTWAIDYLFAGTDPQVSLDHLFILLGKGFTVGDCGSKVGGFNNLERKR